MNLCITVKPIKKFQWCFIMNDTTIKKLMLLKESIEVDIKIILRTWTILSEYWERINRGFKFWLGISRKGTLVDYYTILLSSFSVHIIKIDNLSSSNKLEDFTSNKTNDHISGKTSWITMSETLTSISPACPISALSKFPSFPLKISSILSTLGLFLTLIIL